MQMLLADCCFNITHESFSDDLDEIVQRAEVKKCDLNDLDLAVMREVDDRITEDIYSVLSVQNSVASRASYGGTAPSQVRSQIARWRKTLEL